MSNLTKTTNTTFTPGSKGVPGSPGTPTIPGHYETTTVTVPGAPATPDRYFVWNDGGVGATEISYFAYQQIITTNPRASVFKISGSPATPPTSTSTTVYVPTVVGTPPIAAIPATADTTAVDYNLGWNAGATSKTTQLSDCVYTFSVLSSSIGVVTGLNTSNAGVGYIEIQHGVYFAKGFATVYESGTQAGSSVPFASADVFTIKRVGNLVTYARNGTTFYISTVGSFGSVFADASIYAGGDVITGTSFKALPSGASSNGALVPLGGTASNMSVASATGKLLPLIGTSGITPIGSSYGVIAPLKGVASNYDYTNSAGSLSPLGGDSGAGALTPSYAISAGSFAYLLSAARLLVGEIGGGPGSLAPLTGFSSNRPYASAAGSFAPLYAFGGVAVAINAYSSAILPSATLYGTGHDSTGENGADLTMPTVLLSANGGGNASLVSPTLFVDISGTATATGNADMALPSAIVTASGTVSRTGNGSVYLSLPSALLVGYSGAVLYATLNDGYTVQATGTTGSISTAAVTLPMFTLSSTASLQTIGSANITLPALQMAVTGRGWAILPGFTLTAIGTATVTATYEAYAVNLKHAPSAPGQQVVDEVTRYTNFPFDRIVRYKNSYFGMNATGLFLLEGTTDAGTPTSYAMQTHKTDFGPSENKTVVSLYMGGRMGAVEAVSIIAGETSPVTYSYTTPRGPLAQNYRQRFGRGIKSRYYAFAIAGADTFRLDVLEPEINKLTRSI